MQCKLLWNYLEAADNKVMKRLKYIVSVADLKNVTKCTLIVDESDDVTFKDVELFYRYTKH